MASTILVTGGAGFIGSNFVVSWLVAGGGTVVNFDNLTYAGNLANLDAVKNDPRHIFIRGDIADAKLVTRLLAEHRPRAIVNFAAETHVDRSIHGPEEFIQTNVVGTLRLLAEARSYWEGLAPTQKTEFRFLHVSTDEVYGSLAPDDPAFSEATPYAPNSPYAASKAASDHLVRAYHHTYGLPVLTTHCSNNYGPYQFPEKLIPLMILNAVRGESLPVYGDGLNVRDWLYVDDHCEAIRLVLAQGRVGERYNIGGNTERSNIEVVRAICRSLDALSPGSPTIPHERLINFVGDRLGHDRRYAIDATKLQREFGWVPKTDFEQGLRGTINWYLHNMRWVEQVASGEYRKWIDQQYGHG